MSDPRIARILSKLAALRAHPVETFGASGHRFILDLPLAEATVAALEAKHQIRLPDDYRRFLLEAGASGAGPYYGLLAPAHWTYGLAGDVAMPDFAARPCVWTPDTPRDGATWDALGAGLDEPFQGAIAIADQGCAYYAMLVVTGAARGRVMYVSLEGGVPFFPENDDFLSWYERWVDELGWGYEHHWFGTQMPGDEATLAAAARPADGPRRLDALWAMRQLPALAEATRAVVLARVRDADPAVRSAALGLATRQLAADELAPHLEALLGDDDARVRRAALEALVQGDGAWTPRARAALADPSEDVVIYALRALEKASALRDDDVLPLLDAPAAKLRDAAITSARAVSSPALFDRLLPLARAGDDPHDQRLLAVLAQVRRDAVDGPRRDAALELVRARIAAATGPEPPTAAIHGLRAFAGTHPQALATLLELLRHPEPFFRWTAAAALGELGDADAIGPLRAIVDDPAMPRAAGRSTAWSVGESARRAIAKIEASIAKRS